MKNEINYVVQILKRLRLKILYKIDYKNGFFIKIKSPLRKPFTNVIYKFIIIN